MPEIGGSEPLVEREREILRENVLQIYRRGYDVEKYLLEVGHPTRTFS